MVRKKKGQAQPEPVEPVAVAPDDEEEDEDEELTSPLAAAVIATDVRQDMEYVYHNIGSEATDTELENRAPSPGAWHLLKRCREDAKACSDFYGKMWPKMVAMVNDRANKGFNDDGRPAFNAIERLLGAAG